MVRKIKKWFNGAVQGLSQQILSDDPLNNSLPSAQLYCSSALGKLL